MDNSTGESDDFLATLGALALGSRLKRMADALYADVSDTLGDVYGGIAPNHVPVLLCIDRLGPQTTMELTRRLGLSQPAVTRIVAALKGLGLLDTAVVARDQRQVSIALGEAGRALLKRMKRDYLPSVEAAAMSLFEGAGGDFLDQIAHVERGLKDRSMWDRMRDG